MDADNNIENDTIVVEVPKTPNKAQGSIKRKLDEAELDLPYEKRSKYFASNHEGGATNGNDPHASHTAPGKTLVHTTPNKQKTAQKSVPEVVDLTQDSDSDSEMPAQPTSKTPITFLNGSFQLPPRERTRSPITYNEPQPRPPIVEEEDVSSEVAFSDGETSVRDAETVAQAPIVWVPAPVVKKKRGPYKKRDASLLVRPRQAPTSNDPNPSEKPLAVHTEHHLKEASNGRVAKHSDDDVEEVFPNPTSWTYQQGEFVRQPPVSSGTKQTVSKQTGNSGADSDVEEIDASLFVSRQRPSTQLPPNPSHNSTVNHKNHPQKHRTQLDPKPVKRPNKSAQAIRNKKTLERHDLVQPIDPSKAIVRNSFEDYSNL